MSPQEKVPDLLTLMEPDHPGMHTTDTVDFEYIVSGEVWLELYDGVGVHLRAGDTVVQNGTRHALRNRSSEPCRDDFDPGRGTPPSITNRPEESVRCSAT